MVLSPASVAIAADGLLTLDMPADGGFTVYISVVDGEYQFADPWSWSSFRVASDAAGLEPTISTRGELRVRGITGIDIELRSHAVISILSTDVPVNVRIGSGGGMVILGDSQYLDHLGLPPIADGLASISAPVDVRTTADFFYTNVDTKLWLHDDRAAGDIDYTVTSHSLTSTGGFGGVTFSGLDRLEFDGPISTSPELRQRFDVLSTPAGYTRLSGGGSSSAIFNVDATLGPDERPPWIGPAPALPRIAGVLQLERGAEFNIKRTPSPVRINDGAGDVNLTNDGSTAGIGHKVTIGPWASFSSYSGGGPWRGHILIDASADADAQDALLRADGKTAVLTGAANGEIVMNPEFYGTLEYRAPRARANQMQVDLTGVSPLPDGPGMFTYDGGSGAAGGGPGPKLTLAGELDLRMSRYYPTYNETRLPNVWYEAISPDAGGVRFGWNEDPRSTRTVVFRGLAGGSFVDLIPSDFFALWNRHAAGLDINVGAGAVEQGLQTLQISSPGFVATSVANKSLVGFFLAPAYSGGRKTVDYRSQTPVAGLERLSLPYDFDGGVGAEPPGATTSVEPAPPPRSPDYIPIPIEVWGWTEGFPKGDSTAGGTTNPAGGGDAGAGVSTKPTGPTTPPPPSTEPDPSPTPDPAPVDPTPASPAPVDPTPAPAVPTAPEVLGGGLVNRFGATMRTVAASGGSSRRSPLQTLRTERLARLATLRAIRAERAWHAPAYLRRGWPAG